MEKQSLEPPSDRRGFFAKIGAIVLGGLVTMVPMISGVVVFFDALRRKGAKGVFLPVTTLAALPEDGPPRRFAIQADRTDAWNRYVNVPIGAVYLRRIGPEKVEALNVTCPHAGCPVSYKHATESYLCPCHNSLFHLDGSLASKESPSPRGLDSLEVEIRNGQEIWVKFQNFKPGKPEKMVQS